MMRKLVLIVASVFLAATLAAQVTWTPTSTLPAPVRGGFALYNSGYAYLIGGRPTGEGVGTHAINTVYYAPVNTNGSLGTWQATTPLPGNRAMVGAYAYNGRMYVWGGWGEDYVTHNDCWYATINGDGTLGAWTTSAVTIPDGTGAVAQMDSAGQGVVGFDKFIYVIGGEDNAANIVSNCYYSEIQPSGDFGAWQTATSLPFNDWFHGVATYQGTSANYIYLVGGNHSGTTESQIVRNTINADGSLGPTWTANATDLVQATYELGCATLGDRIFAVGGLSGATPITNVAYCRVNPATGAVTVSETTPLPEARARTTAVAYSAGGNDYLLVVGGGGYSASDPVLDTCVYAELPQTTPVSEWNLYE